ncbi:hypothetical protein EV401DRAFT_1895520 [Pisolithus croceorrhizus]|nr:hypothetical protein EV401DRAFT_1895520 [Pisolithus croceorrhizus]
MTIPKESNIFCYLCHDVCNICINILESIVTHLGTHNISFKCPACHEEEHAPHSEPMPYVLWLNVRGGIPCLLNAALEEYFMEATLQHLEVIFDFGTQNKLCHWQAKAQHLAATISEDIFQQKIIFISGKMKERIMWLYCPRRLFMDYLFAGCLQLLISGATMFMLSCGPLVMFLQSICTFKESLLELRPAYIITFSVTHFIGTVIKSFIVAFSVWVVIQGHNLGEVFTDLLNVSVKLPMHTDAYLFQVEEQMVSGMPNPSHSAILIKVQHIGDLIFWVKKIGFTIIDSTLLHPRGLVGFGDAIHAQLDTDCFDSPMPRENPIYHRKEGSKEHGDTVYVDSETSPHESLTLRRELLGKEQIHLVEHSGTSLDAGIAPVIYQDERSPFTMNREDQGSEVMMSMYILLLQWERHPLVTLHLVYNRGRFNPHFTETVYDTVQLLLGTPLPTHSDVQTVHTTSGTFQEPSEALPTGGDTPTIQMTDVAGDSVVSPEELHFCDNSINLDDIFDGSTFMVGRPSEAVLDMIREGLDHITAYLADLATRSGQPPQQILDRFLKQYARLNPANDWNRYSKYFSHYTERELARLRKSGSFTGSIESTPSATVHKKCYEPFKKDYHDTWQDILIKFKESMRYTETREDCGPTASSYSINLQNRFTQSLIALSKAHVPGTEDPLQSPHITSGNHGQSWASWKPFPWKQLLEKLSQNTLVCINWPDVVLFPGQEHLSHRKPKGISDLTMLKFTQIIAAIWDHGPYRLHFRFESSSIFGVPPLHGSKSSRVKRIFYNCKTDYDGPAFLPDPAKTHIKRQGSSWGKGLIKQSSPGDSPARGSSSILLFPGKIQILAEAAELRIMDSAMDVPGYILQSLLLVGPSDYMWLRELQFHCQRVYIEWEMYSKWKIHFQPEEAPGATNLRLLGCSSLGGSDPISFSPDNSEPSGNMNQSLFFLVPGLICGKVFITLGLGCCMVSLSGEYASCFAEESLAAMAPHSLSSLGLEESPIVITLGSHFPNFFAVVVTTTSTFLWPYIDFGAPLPDESYLDIISCRMYSRDDQFSYDQIPYHPSMNPGCTRGFGHHTNVPPPFHAAHKTEYANAGGSCEQPVRAYCQAQALKVDLDIFQEPTKMLYWIQPVHQLAVILHPPETCEKPKDSLGTGGYIYMFMSMFMSQSAKAMSARVLCITGLGGFTAIETSSIT